jgi:hypothetical protein
MYIDTEIAMHTDKDKAIQYYFPYEFFNMTCQQLTCYQTTSFYIALLRDNGIIIAVAPLEMVSSTLGILMHIL